MARVNAGASAKEGLHSTPSRLMGEAASNASERGSIQVASGGYLAEGGANPTNIIGVSNEDGHNNATAGAKSLNYTPALPHVLFEMTLAKASNLGNYVSLVGDRWTKYGITKDANGQWYVDVDKTGATARVVVVDFVDAVGATEARVLVTFLAVQTIYG